MGRKEKGSQSRVRIWVKNDQDPVRHLPNICFPVDLGGDLVVSDQQCSSTRQGVFFFLLVNIQRHQDSGPF